MREIQVVRSLVAQALNEFDDPGGSVSKNLRRCLRIASLRKDYLNLVWLWREALTAKEPDFEWRQISRDIKSHFSEEDYEENSLLQLAGYTSRREAKDPKDQAGVDPRGVGDLENAVWILETVAAGIPANHGSDSLAAHVTAAQNIATLKAVLARINWRLHRFLMETETQIEYGQVNADIFERNRIYVDQHLAEMAPDALAGFTSAYTRIQEGDAESLSQALTSCRRILKAVADKVYPASSSPVLCADGQERKMTDEKYMNRLSQAVSDSLGRHGQGPVLQSVIQDFSKRISSLNALASKGVHDKVTAAEVDTCVIQTYLLIGDILRVTQGESALAQIVSGKTVKDSGIEF